MVRHLKCIDIQIKQKSINFKMDMGAEVTAIQRNLSVVGEPELRRPSKILYGPAHQALNVLGQFSG